MAPALEYSHGHQLVEGDDTDARPGIAHMSLDTDTGLSQFQGDLLLRFAIDQHLDDEFLHRSQILFGDRRAHG